MYRVGAVGVTCPGMGGCQPARRCLPNTQLPIPLTRKPYRNGVRYLAVALEVAKYLVLIAFPWQLNISVAYDIG